MKMLLGLINGVVSICTVRMVDGDDDVVMAGTSADEKGGLYFNYPIHREGRSPMTGSMS